MHYSFAYVAVTLVSALMKFICRADARLRFHALNGPLPTVSTPIAAQRSNNLRKALDEI